ncbi:MAG: carotenoid 1,2-hydratase [Lysobacterales bacterium]|jgi:predicted secreted hydrolase|nr:MAG: carotenoid 1,2-hydratase [Xanthomonadales bacterium]
MIAGVASAQPTTDAAARAATGTAASPPVAYPTVVPGVELRFPADEGSHPAHRIEWWYVTGWARDTEGSPLGFQVTFFRVRPGLGATNPSRFAARQILFGHAAVADPAKGKLRHAERSAREGFGLAYAREGGVDVRLDDWSLRQDGDRYLADVRGDDFRMQLALERVQPPLLQGDRGYSRKGPSPSQASHYYSLPHLRVSGEIAVDGRSREVTGEAWFDHEWSSDVMDEESRGWDWMGINLDDGGALMAFRMRDATGGARWAAATLRAADGSLRAFPPDQVTWTPLRRWRSPRTGAEYPVEWRVTVGGVSYRVRPLMDDAELDSRASTGTIYWEGPVEIASDDGRPLGRGYLELTGYAGRLDL